MYEKVPQELKELPQWVGWKYVPGDKEGDKPRKVPINSKDGSWAKSNDASTWGIFGQAVDAVARYDLSGIGIMFANNIFGVDIDHCFEDDTIKDFAQEIIDTVQSYTEMSPSGTGIHILCQGELPDGGRKKGDVEMYCAGRFFTVTGNQYGTAYPFSDCTERVRTMHEKYLGGMIRKAVIAPTFRKSLRADSMSISDIIERAFRSKNGDKFRDLYNGDFEKHLPRTPKADGKIDLTQSVADQMFCGMLAFWCQRDAYLMDAIFQQSALMRPKWTSRRGNTTYGEKTIQNAIDQCGKVWEPPQPRPDPIPLPEEPPDDYYSQPPPLPPEQGNEQPPPPKSNGKKFYEYDDTGNAERFRDTYLGEIKFNCTEKKWMYWDSRRWALDITGEVKRKADIMLNQMREDLKMTNEQFYNAFQKHITKSRSHRAKDAFIEETQHRDGIPVEAAEFDRASNVLNVLNGTVSLKTGTVKEHNREHMLSKLAEVRYDSTATCPQWDKFMEDITCGDATLRLYLQRMVGYCLTASTSEQCVFFLYGNGSNGKSTFTDTIAEMLGEYAARCQADTVMQRDKNNSARSDLARLQNKRLVVSEEPNDGCRLNEGIVKQMAGGTDNKLTVRFLYGSEFEFVPQFKIIMSTNYKPTIKGTDNGIWRRIRLIPFNALFEKSQQDKTLPDKLKKEMPGILNWAIAGAVGWYAEGLPPCPLIDTAVQEYRAEMDRIQQFVDDCLHIDADSSIQAATLYSVYKQWCQEQGDRYPLSNMKFYGELRKRFTAKKTAAYNEYLGVSFTDRGATLLTFSTKD